MQIDHLRDLRYKLQKRVRKLNAAVPLHFLYELKRFWLFFDSIPTFQGIIGELLVRFPNIHGEVGSIFAGAALAAGSEAESAALGHGILRRFAAQDNPQAFVNLGGIQPQDFEQMLDEFRALYLEPFYDYLDEHLDDRSFIAATLVRYKHSCEWFRREKLYDLWKSDTRRGERLLAFDLYEYLFEGGIRFQIEPASASGEADMVSIQPRSEPLIADAKIFDPVSARGAAYLKKAVRQIYQYTCDYNQAEGFLIIFNVSGKLLRFALSLSGDPLPRVVYNLKTIFLLAIDVFPYSEPASHRGPSESIEISETEIAGALGLPISATAT